MKLLFHALAPPPADGAISVDKRAADGDLERGLAWLASTLTPDQRAPAPAGQAELRFVLMDRFDLSRAIGGAAPYSLTAGAFAVGVHPRDAAPLGIVAAPLLLDEGRGHWRDIAQILAVLARLEAIARPHDGVPSSAARLDDDVEHLLRQLDRHHANRILEFFDQGGESASVLEAVVRSLALRGAPPAVCDVHYQMIAALQTSSSARLADRIVQIVVPRAALSRARQLVEGLQFVGTPPVVHPAMPAWTLRECGGWPQVAAWQCRGPGA